MARAIVVLRMIHISANGVPAAIRALGQERWGPPRQICRGSLSNPEPLVRPGGMTSDPGILIALVCCASALAAFRNAWKCLASPPPAEIDQALVESLRRRSS